MKSIKEFTNRQVIIVLSITITALVIAVITLSVLLINAKNDTASSSVDNEKRETPSSLKVTQSSPPKDLTDPQQKTNTVEVKEQTIAELFPNRTEAEKIARASADQKWGNNYEMVKYNYDNQMEAYDWLVKQTEHKDIMQGAIDKWGNNYEMVRYNYQNQVEAYNSLQ